MKNIWLIIYLVTFTNIFSINWEVLDAGLEIAEFNIPELSSKADSTMIIIRIDPEIFNFNVFSEKEYAISSVDAISWANKQDLILAVNGGLYEPDGTPTGYYRNYSFLGNPIYKNNYNMCFVCNPKIDDHPNAQLVDLEQANSDSLIENYNTVLQSIRIVDSKRNNVWKTQRYVSVAFLGEDEQGAILIIYTSHYYNIPELVDELLSMSLNLEKLMYLEGLVHSLYFKYGEKQIIRNGSIKLDAGDLKAISLNYMPMAIGLKK